MFHRISRNVTLSRASVVIETRLFQRLFYGSISSSAAKLDSKSITEESFTVSYLINSCGFTPEKAISASKHLNFKTPHRADSVLAFLKEQGFTETQVHDLVKKCPDVLALRPEENLLPKFEFFSSVGFSGSDLVKILTARPRTLTSSLDNRIIPSYNLLRDLLQSDDRTLTAMKRCAWILDWKFQVDVIPNMQILQDVGVPGSRMLDFLTSQPRDFLVSPEEFKKIVDEVKEMGFDPVKLNFISAIRAFRSMRKPTWEKKVKVYEKWGLSKDEVLMAFRKNPWCMMRSEEKINKVIDFFVNKIGCELSAIAKNTIILSLSLEKRIVPRCSVYLYLLDKGLIEKKQNFGFSWWLMCSDVRFVERIKRFEKEAPNLLEFYQEKLDHAK